MDTTTTYQQACDSLTRSPKVWVVTGVAGFIGSHLLKALLELNQEVRGIDNFSTGTRANLDEVLGRLSADKRERFRFREGDVTDAKLCREVIGGSHFVLHHAALGSVPRSIRDPITSNRSNVEGFLQMLTASAELGVQRFVYASSSSVYGDSKDLPKREDVVGNPLSPYAVTKRAAELYASAFSQLISMPSIGLRYFNVYGPRQNPLGEYSAVIPRWIRSLMDGNACTIYGSGETSRDFCFVNDVVQANILSATTANPQALNTVYNIAVSQKTSLNELYALLCRLISEITGRDLSAPPKHEENRSGDIQHSLADTSRARSLLGYEPQFPILDGLRRTVAWFAKGA